MWLSQPFDARIATQTLTRLSLLQIRRGNCHLKRVERDCYKVVEPTDMHGEIPSTTKSD